MSFSITKTFLNLSSTDKSSGNNNDFIIQFNNAGLTTESNGYFGSKSYINPIFFNLANNWQNIQLDYNDTFWLGGSYWGGGNGVAVKIPAGVYQTPQQLASAIQTAVAGVINVGITPFYAGSLTVAYYVSNNADINWQHMAFTFTSSAPAEVLKLYFTVNTPITVSQNPYNFAQIVGVDASDITLTPGQTKYGEYVPNLILYDMIQIQCNLCKATFEIESGILSPSIIMVSFPVGNYTVNNQVVFLNNNPMLYRQEMRSPNFDTIQIRVVDKNGRLIPFIGEIDMSFIIERELVNEPFNAQRVKDQNPYTANFN
jgi:hypothetical protein